MTAPLRLMAILAHPDDESLGLGGTLARYAREGIETYVITATRGEAGRYGNYLRTDPDRPPTDVVAKKREGELRAAARVLGVRQVHFLDYIDGELDEADPREAAARIAGHIRRIRPQVVVTFAPDGAYGHPDHIAICQFTQAGIVRAADPEFPGDHPPHAVAKLYYMAWTEPKWAAYQAAFKQLKTTIDGVDRYATPWADWAVTTVVDTTAYWSVAWEAISCHETQLAIYTKLADLPPEYHQSLWGSQEFYRAFSLVNGGRTRETDLFEGLR